MLLAFGKQCDGCRSSTSLKVGQILTGQCILDVTASVGMDMSVCLSTTLFENDNDDEQDNILRG